MCDDHSLDDMLQYERQVELSRRRFGALAIGAGMISMLPRVAGAAPVSDAEVQIRTPDGVCDAYFVHPASGKSPAVLVWPDIFGLRPAFKEMGKRLAESGYAVLVVNPFYRKQKAPTAPENPDFQNPDTRTKLFALAGSLTAAGTVIDATAFMSWLDKQSAVDTRRKAATTGYCMGGPLVFRTAAALPARIGAMATFHGGGLVTDQPDSPHLLVPKLKAQALLAIAQNDDQKQPEAKDVLRAAFDKANLPAEIEVYPAQHGWCPPDSRAYDHDQSEKAWGRMLVLFKGALS
jgi:carboxymethylenebutenolidase